MKVLSVEIEDFLSIGTARFELDDKGLCLVQGENIDNSSAVSNGAGKSSLVDGIMWALYGETARGASTSEVIRHGAKGARVRVLLADEDGMTYGVERRRSKSRVELSLVQCKAALATTAVTDLTLGTVALTQEKIVQILGCSAEVFRSAVYLGQEQMPDLPRMTDKKLKELIEEASGLAVIEECYQRARINLATLENQAHVERAELARTEGALQGVRRQVEVAREDMMNWADEHARRYASATAHLDVCSTKHRDAVAHQRKLALEATAAEKRLVEIASELHGFETARKALQEAQKALLTAERAVANAESDAKVALLHRKQAEEHLAHIEDGQPCESCGQDLPADDLATLRQHAADAVATARTSALEAARNVKAARQRAEQARAQSAEIERSVPDVSALQAEAETLRAVVQTAQDAEREALHWQTQVTHADKTAAAIHKESNPHLASLERAEAALDATGETHKTQSEALKVLETTIADAKAVVAVFGPSGVRAEILDQVTPYLNARTAAYLDALSDGTLKALWTTIVRDAKGNPREKFSIEVTHPAGEGFVVLSGGEKRKVRLATALALQDLVASRATKPMHLFVADEIDDALDDAGLERLMGVLSEKAREKGTVLVISHNSLTDWIPTAWVVRKERGVATLETA